MRFSAPVAIGLVIGAFIFTSLYVLYCTVQYISMRSWTLYCFLQYTSHMEQQKSQILQIRLSAPEKKGFDLAASLAGISLSSWVRERLRLSAIRELEGAGRRVPFVPEVPPGGRNVRA